MSQINDIVKNALLETDYFTSENGKLLLKYDSITLEFKDSSTLEITFSYKGVDVYKQKQEFTAPFYLSYTSTNSLVLNKLQGTLNYQLES